MKYYKNFNMKMDRHHKSPIVKGIAVVNAMAITVSAVLTLIFMGVSDHPKSEDVVTFAIANADTTDAVVLETTTQATTNNVVETSALTTETTTTSQTTYDVETSVVVSATTISVVNIPEEESWITTDCKTVETITDTIVETLSETTTQSSTTLSTTTSTTTIETTTVEVETTTETETESFDDLPISESDYILICNCVAHEAGANNINATEKAKVVEVIMNRVYSDKYPNTVYEVITQKNQFSGCWNYANLDTYSNKVTDLVKEAVNLYFEDPSQFDHGYIGFWGDGRQNHFRTS